MSSPERVKNTPKMDPKKGGFWTPQKGGVDPPSGGYPPKPVRGGPRRLGIGTFFGGTPHPGGPDPEKGGSAIEKSYVDPIWG